MTHASCGSRTGLDLPVVEAVETLLNDLLELGCPVERLGLPLVGVNGPVVHWIRFEAVQFVQSAIDGHEADEMKDFRRRRSGRVESGRGG